MRDEDDALALHRMMSGVTPLESRARRIPRSESSLPRGRMEEHRAVAEDRARDEVHSVHAHLRALVEGGRFEVEDDGRRVEGRRAGLPPDVLRKLRRGLMPIDARLDLHGLRAEEAADALDRFLAEKHARGDRCVLVVHGKGEHSPGRRGVLRGEMSAWLSQGAASVHVAAFSTAEPQDGGEGAVYVLIAR
jgi:DNA-nicking Smr family endonuclease